MAQNLVKAKKLSNFLKVVGREEGSYVPTAICGSLSSIAWAGYRPLDIIHDPQKCAEALTAVFDEMWVDVSVVLGSTITDRLQNALEGIENYYGPDGCTLEHVQLSPMQKDEYDQLIADPASYISQVLLPQKYARFYADREYAKNALKAYAEDRVYMFTQLTPLVNNILEEKYGAVSILNMANRVEPPLDMIFDYFRGFRGTLTDLRRQPDKVKAACDKLWETRCLPVMQQPYTGGAFPYAGQVPHIPCYLSPKQFEEFYWVHEKPQLERIANAGGKTYIFLEGRWQNYLHYFRELPKDSLVLHVDDDDIVKVKKEIGDWQIISGGLSLADVRMKSFVDIKDSVKRVVDECGAGGGFIYTTDKVWLSPGDVNQTLIDTFNFVHEYTTK